MLTSCRSETTLRHRSQCSTTSSTSTNPPKIDQISKDLKSHKTFFHVSLKKSAFVLLIVYFFIPIWTWQCSWLRRQLVFLNNINFDPFLDVSNPVTLGFECARNFYLRIPGSNGPKLGIWHLAPSSLAGHNHSCLTLLNNPETEFLTDRPVFLYLHGTGTTRATGYRRKMYKVLTDSRINAHVITFDYRGYGDSSNLTPTIPGLIEDATFVYRWLRKRVSPSRLIVWGHSMGSGIAVQLAVSLADSSEDPIALVLESPFTSMYDASSTFPLSLFHRFLPFYEQTVAFQLGTHTDTAINNDDKIHLLNSALLMLHAEDDSFLWVRDARRLHHLASRGRTALLRYVEFRASLGYGHENIFLDPGLPDIVSDFLREVKMHFNSTGN